MHLFRAFSLLMGLLVAGQVCLAQDEGGTDQSQPGQAQDAPPDARKQYQVEIVAFQYRGPDSSGGETFDRLSVEDFLPSRSFDIDRYNRIRDTISYTSLSHLDGALERLQTDPRFSVLLANAWVQPLLNKSEAIDVPLGGELSDEGLARPDAGSGAEPAAGAPLGDSGETDEGLSAQNDASGPYAGTEDGPVRGTLRVFGDYLLFVELNMEAKLPRPGEPAQSSESSYSGDTGYYQSAGSYSPFEVFHISEKRRIKLDEFNYFDHPYIGAIVSVTRYEGPLPESTGTQ